MIPTTIPVPINVFFKSSATNIVIKAIAAVIYNIILPIPLIISDAAFTADVSYFCNGVSNALIKPAIFAPVFLLSIFPANQIAINVLTFNVLKVSITFAIPTIPSALALLILILLNPSANDKIAFFAFSIFLSSSFNLFNDYKTSITFFPPSFVPNTPNPDNNATVLEVSPVNVTLTFFAAASPPPPPPPFLLPFLAVSLPS